MSCSFDLDRKPTFVGGGESELRPAPHNSRESADQTRICERYAESSACKFDTSPKVAGGPRVSCETRKAGASCSALRSSHLYTRLTSAAVVARP